MASSSDDISAKLLQAASILCARIEREEEERLCLEEETRRLERYEEYKRKQVEEDRARREESHRRLFLEKRKLEENAAKEKAKIEKLRKFYKSEAGFGFAEHEIFNTPTLFGVELKLMSRSMKNPHGASSKTLRYLREPEELEKERQEESKVKRKRNDEAFKERVIVDKLRRDYKSEASFSFAGLRIFNSNSLSQVEHNLKSRAKKNPHGASSKTLLNLQKPPEELQKDIREVGSGEGTHSLQARKLYNRHHLLSPKELAKDRREAVSMKVTHSLQGMEGRRTGL